MKKIDAVILTGLIGAIIYSNCAGVSSTLDDLQNDVLRMHILANSDSDEDQALKLKVRDKLLECSEEIFGDSETLTQMKEVAEGKLEEINEIVLQVIDENGFDYTSCTQLVNMEFDERIYGEITMPAGAYDALRITIGEAKGHNWWCVMYPPLCIPAADEVEGDTDTAKDYFDSDELDILENPEDYKVRFKCVEVFNSIKKKFKKII